MAADQGPRLRANLEHRSQGRVRVRVPKNERNQEAFERVQRHLAAHADVGRVTVNMQSGSVLVEGEHTDALHAALGEVIEILARVEPNESAGVDAAVALVRSVDERLTGLSDGRVSLRWLVPAAFLTVGLRRLLAEGLTLGNVPWYVLIYYGIDSFLKLYPEHGPQGRPRLQIVSDGD